MNAYKRHASRGQICKHAELMQSCPRLACKNACICSPNYMENTRNCTQIYLPLQAIYYHTAGKFTCKLQVC